MPELPEVETTRQGLQPHITGQTIKAITIRQRQLRWPISRNLAQHIKNKTIKSINRRGKYLLLEIAGGTLIWHLGMSGCLRIVNQNTAAEKHDHVDILLTNHKLIRFSDPRRFGALLWSKENITEHKLLKHLGPEPLTDEFSGDYLFTKSRKRKTPIKTFIMDNKIVVGIGNIYANEALFIAGITPTKVAGIISKLDYAKLTVAIKKILSLAIKHGGTTLKDFLNSNGNPGYFQQQLSVYGRANQACKQCNKPLKEIRLAQRSTVFCASCQK